MSPVGAVWYLATLMTGDHIAMPIVPDSIPGSGDITPDLSTSDCGLQLTVVLKKMLFGQYNAQPLAGQKP